MSSARHGAEGQLLGRAARISHVAARYGLRELFGGSAADGAVSTREQARRLRSALEELGPTFAKLGQILSTRPDLLPAAFIEELATLQDNVPPLTEADVVAVMEQELGVPWEDVFDTIDPTPLAAGTIAQVHRATLGDGERVVAKVQRPNAEPEILQDLGLLELFGEKTAGRPAFRQLVDLPAIIEHLSVSLQRELDFRQEAANIERMRGILAGYSHLDVPRVFEAVSTSRLLVMEEVQGVPIRDAPPGAARTEAARQLLESYYRQILVEGFFHADPHPGNLKWWKDSIYFLDFGMVGEVDPEVRELLLLVVMAFWQRDAMFLADVTLALSAETEGTPPSVDVEAFRRDLDGMIRRHSHSSLREIELGPVMQDLTEIAVRQGVPLPASMALTGKALAQMQLATAELDPSLDALKVAGDFVMRTMSVRIRERVSPRRLFYEGQKLRVRAVRLAEAIERVTGARPGQRLQVEFRGTERLEDAIRRASQRVALGVVAAAALVAAAITAGEPDLGDWVPVSLGATGTLLTAIMLLDLIRRR